MVPLKTDVFVKLWGLPVIVRSNGRKNEHFLRFNFPHNCWKETKLSVVNIESHCVKSVPLPHPRETSYMSMISDKQARDGRTGLFKCGNAGDFARA